MNSEVNFSGFTRSMRSSLTRPIADANAPPEAPTTSTRKGVLRDDGPSTKSTFWGVLGASLIHAGVLAMAPPGSASTAMPPESYEVEMALVTAPAPEPEPEETPQVVQAVVAKPRPQPIAPRPAAPAPIVQPAQVAPSEPKVAPPEEVAPEPAPAIDAAAPALVASEGTSSSHSIVHHAGGALGANGRGGSLAGRGIPGGSGEGQPSATRGTGYPVQLPLKEWRCPWPSEAEYEDFDEQVVAIQVLVAANGQVEKADILADPGYGFGRAARDCARRARFVPARDALGNTIRAKSPPIRVRFVR